MPEGHVDLFLKEAVPIGKSKKIVIEVKTSIASQKNVDQVFSYTKELGNECIKGILVASKFSKKVINYAKQKNVGLVIYAIDADFNQSMTFDTLLSKLNLKCLS